MIWLLLAAADMQVRIDTKLLPLLRVEVTLKDPAKRLCTAIMRGGKGIKGLKPMPDDPDCFEPASAYHVDLKALDSDNPDYAAESQGGWIWNDQAVILRPEPLPDDFAVEVHIDSGPAGTADRCATCGAGPVTAVSVWPKKGDVYVADSDALAGGAYWGLGRWDALKPIRVADRDVPIWKTHYDFDDAVLRAGVERSLTAVSTFHGMLPAERMIVFLAPARFSSDGGVFGSVMRRHWATAMLIYGGRASAKAFDGDWLAVHELFHTVMPHIKGRPPWFIEGFTTYYQDVLRARVGMRTEQEMWDDLHDGNARFCQPDGTSLAEDSRDLRKTHKYQRVYWGGACVALILDTAMRGKGTSLDAVLKQAWKDGMLTTDEMIARLDQASGLRTQALLDETKHIDLQPTYLSLGLKAKNNHQVELLTSSRLHTQIMAF